MIATTILLTYISVCMTSMVRSYEFTEGDKNLSKELLTEHVPLPQLIMISVGIPLLAITILTYKKFLKSGSTDWLILSWVLLCLWLSSITTACVTEIIKRVVGEPRPCFFAMCDYQYFRTNNALYNQLTNPNIIGLYGLCQETQKNVLESHLSFPSGHASFVFSGMLSSHFISRILHGSSVYLSVTFALIAILVSVSRVIDHRHYIHDIIAGAILGTFITTVIWKYIIENELTIAGLQLSSIVSIYDSDDMTEVVEEEVGSKLIGDSV